MYMEKLTIIVSPLIAVSIASERLVEIIKGFSPFLNKENVNEDHEDRRKSSLQILAVVSGIITSIIANSLMTDVIDGLFKDIPLTLTILAIGLLASGGSGFWNSILTYFPKNQRYKRSESG